MIDHCDANDDQKLSKEEGLACVKKAREANPENAEFWNSIEKKIEERFEAADSNGNGKLSKHELSKELLAGGDAYKK